MSDSNSDTSLLDFGPATTAVAAVLRGLRDDQLGHPTPCPAYTVGDIVDHVRGLTYAFTASARREPLGEGASGPSGDASRLEPGWREQIGGSLAELAEAWSRPEAYDGMAHAGPVELPAAVAAAVALNEVVVHGWDLAVASGQAYDVEPAAVAACLAFAESFEAPEEANSGELFGPPVPVAADAALLDRLVGATGRDPGWTAG